jgi:alpha-amylase
MDPLFFNEWLDYLRAELGHEFFTVGEFWAPYDLPLMLEYINVTGGRMSLFDAPLQANFHKASKDGKEFNLCSIFDNTLVKVNPEMAVTLVENHDTQPLQSLEQPVEPWFRPIAYAFILLREAGYPCLFYTDLYGAKYKDKGGDGQDYKVTLEKLDGIEILLQARKNLAYGQQRDYFDHPNCVGWTRSGDEEHTDSGCAVIISNSEAGTKNMEIGQAFAGKIMIDMLKRVDQEITINADGWAEFKVNAGSVSVWVLKK